MMVPVFKMCTNPFLLNCSQRQSQIDVAMILCEGRLGAKERARGRRGRGRGRSERKELEGEGDRMRKEARGTEIA